jgi:circadian clock protein KaiC
MTKERVSSGVAGLDTMLGGGYVTGRTMLVAGGPGTGKTILSWHFLFEGIANDENVVLVSLDQSQETIVNDISEFGWRPERAINSGNLTILSGKLNIVPTDGHYEYVISFQEPFLREQPLTVPRLAELINKKAEEADASRIAIDGLGPLIELAGDEFRVRQLVYGFIQDLNSRNNTILLTHELRKSNQANNDLPYFLSDGVIELDMLYSSGDYVRTMRIVKVRGIKHVMKPVMFKISDDGIVAFPEARLPE